MKYLVEVTPPSAKRMEGSGILVVTFEDGWTYGGRKEIPITGSVVEFEIKDHYEYIKETKVLDGATFDVFVEYSNKDKTRKEVINLKPTKVE